MILNNCRIIGLTGGIGTGKSTVSNLLKEKDYIVIDADEISREVVEVGKPAYKDIVEAFGLNILLEDRTLNRKKLSRLIFSSKVLRQVLNDIVHPRVFESISSEIEEKCKDNDIVFLDIPLLFEVIEKFEEYKIELSDIWLVYTDIDTQVNRLMERDKISQVEAITKIKTQLSLEEKKGMASCIIDNNGDLTLLQNRIEDLVNGLK